MANILRGSYINPIQTYNLEQANLPQYSSRFMDDYMFVDQIKPWEQPVEFATDWLKADGLRLQYETNYQPLQLQILKSDGQKIFEGNFLTKQQNFFDPDFFIRQAEFALNNLDYGCYTVRVVSSGLTLHSEKIKVSESLPHTLLLQYSHYERYQNIYFQSPFAPMLRVPASLKYIKTAMKSTVYEDQPLNETMVKAIPYRIFRFVLGGSVGVPPYLIDKVARIFGCNEVRIDGRYFTKNGEGAEFDANELDGYPMAGWSIEIREKYNRDGPIYENDVVVSGKNVAMAVIGTKGFGTQNTDYDTITDIN